MFIHIGGDTVVSTKDVITIMDAQSVKNSKITKKFIEDEKKVKRLIDTDMEEVKSYIITKDVIYCSPISSLTLRKRAQFIQNLDQFPSVQIDLEELT
jgi:extracellular matrix regulatory protein B